MSSAYTLSTQSSQNEKHSQGVYINLLISHAHGHKHTPASNNLHLLNTQENETKKTTIKEPILNPMFKIYWKRMPSGVSLQGHLIDVCWGNTYLEAWIRHISLSFRISALPSAFFFSGFKIGHSAEACHCSTVIPNQCLCNRLTRQFKGVLTSLGKLIGHA